MTWSPNKESNSIANLVAHIRGCVHSRIETIFYDIADSRDRDKEFEYGLKLSIEEAYNMTKESFNISNTSVPTQICCYLNLSLIVPL
ncbi:DUF1572 family protein [Paenibacillus pabuli]|uniref:DUF1572 family protein n=1 Tax=Paenibacillus pabuli TaxID=1472 RepID=UPI0012F805F0